MTAAVCVCVWIFVLNACICIKTEGGEKDKAFFQDPKGTLVTSQTGDAKL